MYKQCQWHTERANPDNGKEKARIKPFSYRRVADPLLGLGMTTLSWITVQMSFGAAAP